MPSGIFIHKPQQGFQKGHKITFGNKNGMWKGDRVGYRALHRWVISNLGKAVKCEYCGKEWDKPKSIHWANRSHNYLRDLSDWISLCVSCHKIYDGYTGEI